MTNTIQRTPITYDMLPETGKFFVRVAIRITIL